MVVIHMKLIKENKIHFHHDVFTDNRSTILFSKINSKLFFFFFRLVNSTRESARRSIVPANPLLNRRIPSFLRVYSQASSSNDILLQWQLFSLSELESFDAMMTKLYKDENLTRVQSYENYRALLVSTLASKTSSTNENFDDDNDVITTTAL
jgi:hypothetical protein